jgi:hypothetical protein
MAPRLGRFGAFVAPIEGGRARRLVMAGVAGLLLTAPISLQYSVAPHPALSWLLTLAGAALAAACLRESWVPPAAAARAAGAVCLVFCLVALALGIRQTIASETAPDRQLVCANDVAPDTMVGGRQVASGVNPYASFDLLQAEVQLGCAHFEVTPLRAGVFAARADAPPQAAIDRAARGALAGHPTAGLLTGFNYPAGTALLGMLGAHALVLLSALALVVAWALAVRSAPLELRRATALALGAQVGLIAVLGTAQADAIVGSLLVLACLWRRSPAGGMALGLACAIKQTAWFVAPALLVLSWRESRRAGTRYTGTALAAFATLNAPFIAMGALSWAHAVLAPQLSPEFPYGFGPGAMIVAATHSAFASALFTALMAGLVGGGAAWCAFAPRRLAPAGVLIASLGLWIGPRSLGNYVALLGAVAVATVIGSGPVRVRATRSVPPATEPAHEPAAQGAFA